MAEKKSYTVIHPVRHDGYLHGRGETLKLNDADALRLLDRGVITTGAPEVVQVVVPQPTVAEALASFSKLNAMNRQELVDYGRSTYGLELLSDDKKEQLVQAIHERYVSAYVPAETVATV